MRNQERVKVKERKREQRKQRAKERGSCQRDKEDHSLSVSEAPLRGCFYACGRGSIVCLTRSCRIGVVSYDGELRGGRDREWSSFVRQQRHPRAAYKRGPWETRSKFPKGPSW